MELNSLKTKIIGKKIIFLDEISSTNDEAKRLLSLGYSEGTIVIAKYQVKGKGRLGRRWVSPPGGIYLSIILKPYKDPLKLPLLTLVSALSAIRTIRGLTKLDAMVKWPNDVLISGRKVGGILCEKAKDAIIAGIGINVNVSLNLFPQALKKQVTSLKFELGEELNVNRFITILLEEFDKLYSDFLHRKYSDIISEWASYCDTLGSAVSIETSRGIVEGIASAVGPRGELLVRQADGKIKKIYTADAVKVS